MIKTTISPDKVERKVRVVKYENKFKKGDFSVSKLRISSII